MSVGEELRDPWGWLVAGVTGGLGWAVLATPLGPPAVAVGAAIGAAVLGTKVALGARSGRSDDAGAARRRQDRLPSVPRNSTQYRMVVRAGAAIDRLADLVERPSDPWIADEVQRVLSQSQPVLASLTDLAGRVTIVDNSVSAARPDLLAREIESLQRTMSRTSDPDVRREQDRALAALDSQADSVDRLLRRRDALLAQMQATAVGLEGLATRTGELVALGAASRDTEEAGRIVSDLTQSLDVVRAGIEEARNVLRDL